MRPPVRVSEANLEGSKICFATRNPGPAKPRPGRRMSVPLEGVGVAWRGLGGTITEGSPWPLHKNCAPPGDCLHPFAKGIRSSSKTKNTGQTPELSDTKKQTPKFQYIHQTRLYCFINYEYTLAHNSQSVKGFEEKTQNHERLPRPRALGQFFAFVRGRDI